MLSSHFLNSITNGHLHTLAVVAERESNRRSVAAIKKPVLTQSQQDQKKRKAADYAASRRAENLAQRERNQQNQLTQKNF